MSAISNTTAVGFSRVTNSDPPSPQADQMSTSQPGMMAVVLLGSQTTKTREQEEAERAAKVQREMDAFLLAAAKAFDNHEQSSSYYPAVDQLILRNKIIQFSIAGGVIGGALGSPGGIKGMCIGSGIGMGIGAIAALYVYKKYMPNSYKKWLQKQTKESILALGKVLDCAELIPFRDTRTKNIMIMPARGPCGHVHDFEYYKEKLKESRGLDPQKPKLGFCPSLTFGIYVNAANPNQCQFTVDELRLDYVLLGRLTYVVKDLMNVKIPSNEGLSAMKQEALKFLAEDLTALGKHCFDLEKENNEKLLKRGEIDMEQWVSRNAHLVCALKGKLPSQLGQT